jgi:hypothetical protein
VHASTTLVLPRFEDVLYLWLPLNLDNQIGDSINLVNHIADSRGVYIQPANYPTSQFRPIVDNPSRLLYPKTEDTKELAVEDTVVFSWTDLLPWNPKQTYPLLIISDDFDLQGVAIYNGKPKYILTVCYSEH